MGRTDAQVCAAIKFKFKRANIYVHSFVDKW
jgi:hypothetical protein